MCEVRQALLLQLAIQGAEDRRSLARRRESGRLRLEARRRREQRRSERRYDSQQWKAECHRGGIRAAGGGAELRDPMCPHQTESTGE